MKNLRKKEAPKQAAAKPAAKKNQGFGGFSAGFLNAAPKKKTAAAPAKAKPKVEDHTDLKAKEKNANLKFDEVQDAMKMGDHLTKNKD